MCCLCIYINKRKRYFLGDFRSQPLPRNVQRIILYIFGIRQLKRQNIIDRS